LTLTQTSQPDLSPLAGLLTNNRARISEICACAIVALMTQQVLGSISVVLQIALTFILTVLNWPTILGKLGRAWPVLLLPALAVASTLWSEDRGVSFRYSIQLSLTYYAAIAIAGSVKLSKLVSAIYVATLIIGIGSVLSGKTGNSVDGRVLIGLTGSKNQIAGLAQLLLAACPLLAFDRTQPMLLRLSILITIPLALKLLLGANSATGILTAIGSAGLIFGLMIIKPVPPSGRLAILLAVAVMATPFVVLKDTIIEEAQSISANVFHKDPGLTGRAYLWAQADRLIQDKPVLGHGYRATWLGKSAGSIGLLRWANIPDGRGFNFHNTYKELGVDMGMLGDIVFVIGIGFAALNTLYRYLQTGDLSIGFILVMVGTVVARTFSELQVGPFTIPVLLCAIAATVELHARGLDDDDATELAPAPA
jgi:exopolysaccharide production protein ExoQ